MDALVSSITTTDTGDTGRRIKAIIGASSGNLVEWYDFYAHMRSPLDLFLRRPFSRPAMPPASFCASLPPDFRGGVSLMRPLGGWLFGWIADRHGRRNSMMISVLMMCAGSLMIAMLPTYATIGALAQVLLLVSHDWLSGTLGRRRVRTAATYMSEVAGKGHRGFYSSFQYVTLIGGQLLALLVLVLLQSALSTEQLKAWGWRIPFVVGALTAARGECIRRSFAGRDGLGGGDAQQGGRIAGRTVAP